MPSCSTTRRLLRYGLSLSSRTSGTVAAAAILAWPAFALGNCISAECIYYGRVARLLTANGCPAAGAGPWIGARLAKPPRHLADLDPAGRHAAVRELGQRPYRADQ